MLKKILVLLLVFATMLPTLFAELDALEAARGRPEAPAFVADQVLVNFQSGVTTADIATFMPSMGWWRSSGWAPPLAVFPD